MKNIMNNIKWSLFAVLALSIIMVSCEDDDNLGNPDRMFRPVVNETTYGGNWIRYVWDPYQGVDYYELELSTDSFKTITNYAKCDTSFYTFEGLEYDTDYLLRIKCVGEIEGLESKYYIAKIVTTSDFPTQLSAVTSRTDKQAKIEWGDAEYDSLTYFYAYEDVRVAVHQVSEAENANKWAVISGLMPDSTYIVRAYKEGEYQGKKSFSARSAQTFPTAAVVDHRGLTAEEAKGLLTTEYFANLASQYPDGDVTIVLDGAVEYDVATVEIASGFTMTTGYSLWGSAILKVSGEMKFLGTLKASKVKFDNIEVSDHASKPKTASYFGGTYFLNLPTAGYHVDSLLFNDCTIRYKRGLIRNRVEGTINYISFNNCFVDSISGYGVIDFSKMSCQKFELKKSTFAHCEIIARNDQMLTALGEMNVENVSFVNVPAGSSYIFRGKNFGTVNIKKNIFAAPFSGTSTSGLLITSGDVFAEDNFNTSDCVWTTVTGGDGSITTPTAINAEQLTTDTNGTFKNPSSSDYTLIVSKLKNKAGDPRWW